MTLRRLICKLLCLVLVDSYVINHGINPNIDAVYLNDENFNQSDHHALEIDKAPKEVDKQSEDSVFNGVYSECFLYLSYSCIQKKTLLYLQKLNDLNEVSVVGDYLKFVKVNTSDPNGRQDLSTNESSADLSLLIDNTVNKFFDNHVLRFKALGRDISIPRTDEFVGRKKRKGGGGGGGGGHGGGHGGDDGGKKKMMMMAMMCMKMKLMMMVPAMMGMMGMMSFKGMMFSMMSFMVSKMMLLMKILEKKGLGGGGGGGGGGGDGGWAAGGGGGGAWMPAGGPDYGGGGGGGGYDANGQWQSRTITDIAPDKEEDQTDEEEEKEPIISYVTPNIRYGSDNNAYVLHKNYNEGKTERKTKVKRDVANEYVISDVTRFAQKFDGNTEGGPDNLYTTVNQRFSGNNAVNEHYGEAYTKEYLKPKSRSKRGIVDIIQNAYLYWINRILGNLRFNKMNQYPKYKMINGVKYIYSPLRNIYKPKAPKAMQPENMNAIKNEEFKPIITVSDFNRGEIVEAPDESRMHKKKIQKIKETVDEAIEENPWQ